MTILEAAIVLALAAIIFYILFKYLRWAIEAIIVFVLVLLGIYVALRILGVNDAGGVIREFLNEVRVMLGF